MQINKDNIKLRMNSKIDLKLFHIMDGEHVSVSYTHLDVYKRQL